MARGPLLNSHHREIQRAFEESRATLLDDLDDILMASFVHARLRARQSIIDIQDRMREEGIRIDRKDLLLEEYRK